MLIAIDTAAYSVFLVTQISALATVHTAFIHCHTPFCTYMALVVTQVMRFSAGQFAAAYALVYAAFLPVLSMGNYRGFGLCLCN